MTDLLTIAEARIAEKQVAEIKAVKKRLDMDREVLMQAIELVNSHTLYKKVSEGWGEISLCFSYRGNAEERLFERTG
jgi:hypothetical protein